MRLQGEEFMCTSSSWSWFMDGASIFFFFEGFLALGIALKVCLLTVPSLTFLFIFYLGYNTIMCDT